jgi:DNA-binding cell septation regulator SpoVG
VKVEVKIVESHRQSVKAAAKVKLTFDDGSVIVIDDIRVLENKQGTFWVSMPMYVISDGKKDWVYHPSVILSNTLNREVSDAILAAYKKQNQAKPQPSEETEVEF